MFTVYCIVLYCTVQQDIPSLTCCASSFLNILVPCKIQNKSVIFHALLFLLDRDLQGYSLITFNLYAWGGGEGEGLGCVGEGECEVPIFMSVNQSVTTVQNRIAVAKISSIEKMRKKKKIHPQLVTVICHFLFFSSIFFNFVLFPNSSTRILNFFMDFYTILI